MRGSPIYFSKKQLAIFWAAIFGFLTLTAITVLAQEPNLQIDPSKAPPPLCAPKNYNAQRFGAPVGDCWRLAGASNESDNGHGIITAGVPLSDSETCWVYWYALSPVPLGTRGSSYCPALDEMVRFTTSAERVADSGKFTINWTAATALSCTLSGKAPEVGNFSEDFSGDGSWIRGSRTYDFVKRGVYNFQFKCNGYADNSKSTAKTDITRNLTVFVGNIPPAPKVTLKIDPEQIKKGEQATLSWTSENVLSVSINQGIGIVGKTGSMKVSPGFTTRYTVTAAGEFAELGLARYSVSLSVIAENLAESAVPSAEVPPDVVEAVQQVQEKPVTDVQVNGQDDDLTVGVPSDIKISWNLDKYCIAYGSWLGIKTKAGMETRTLSSAGTYTYKLYCPGYGTDQVVVKAVGGAGGGSQEKLPVAEASVSTDGKNFFRSIRVEQGKAVKLWLSAGFDVNGDRIASRDDAGGWGTVLSKGGRCEWNSDLNQGVPEFDIAMENPTNAKYCTYYVGEVKFFDKPGVYNYGVLRLIQANGKVSNTSAINIAVQPPPPPDTPPIVDLRINGKENEVLLGAPAEYDLIWDVRNADTCSASGDWSGEKFLGGAQKFVTSTKKELTYTLTCVGKLGTTVKNMNVKVAELPVCDFSALPLVLDKSSVFDRQSALSWKCQFANTCSISPSTGASVGVFGTARVSPEVTTNYTLTCENLEGSSSFDQLIEVR